MRVKPEKPFILPSRPGFYAPVRILQAKISPFRPERECSKRILKPDYPLFLPLYAGYFPASLKPNTESSGLGLTAGVARSCLEAPPPSFQSCTVGTVLGQHGTFSRICEMIRTNQVCFHFSIPSAVLFF